MFQKARIIIMFFLAALVFISVPLYFINFGSGPVGEFITRVLGIRVDPVYSGGELMTVINDPYDDDKGTGTYTYPDAKEYSPYSGHLDLVKYIVRKPVHKSAWSEFNKFWAMELVFNTLENPLNAPAGFSFPLINIFISLEGKNGGTTRSVFSGIQANFDPAHPWHYLVIVNGWEIDGSLYNSKGKYVSKVLIDIIKKDDKIRITIPIENNPDLENLTDKSISYHYVAVGNFSLTGENHFKPIFQKASIHFGGGNPDPEYGPRIYDYLQPAESQYEILSAFDPGKKKFAVLTPVKVVAGKGLHIPDNETRITGSNENTYQAEKRKRKLDSLKSLMKMFEEVPDDVDVKTELACLYFDLGEDEKALTMFNQLQEEPDSDRYLVIAYLGALHAKKAASKRSTVEKIVIIKESLAMLDRAVSQVEPDSLSMVHVLMCRANVCRSIPNEVFGKLDTAIADFRKLKKLSKINGLKETYINVSDLLGDCYIGKGWHKKAVDSYYDGVKMAAVVGDEYHVLKLKNRMLFAEKQYLDRLIMNL